MQQIQFTPFPTIETERLILRRQTRDDKAEFFISRNDEEMRRYLSSPRLKDLDDAVELIEKLDQGVIKNEWIIWAMSLKNDPNQKYIGSVCLWNISLENAVAEIGFVLLPPFQGNGLMQEALQAAINYGFNIMLLNEIIAITAVNNRKSIALVERNGFICDPDFSLEENTVEKQLIMGKYVLKK